MGYFAVAYGIAIGAAFLPLEPVWLKWIVAVVLLGIYAWYVKGHFEADASVDLEDLAPLRFHRLDRTAHRDDPAEPRLRIVNVQVIAALGLIILGAVFFVDAVEHLASQFGVDELLLALVIAPDRDGAAREVQLRPVGPPGQGHPCDGQHHRSDGLPVDDPDGRRPGLRLEQLGHRARLVHRVRLGRHRLPVVRVHLPADGPIRAPRGRGLLVGGVFYLAYLVLVGLVVTGTIGGVGPSPLIYSASSWKEP